MCEKSFVCECIVPMAGGRKKTSAPKLKSEEPTTKKVKHEEVLNEDEEVAAGVTEDDVKSETTSDSARSPIPDASVDTTTASTTDSQVDGDSQAEVKYDIGGRLLICGGTNWDLIGRKELPKSAAKNAAQTNGRNLWGPHVLADFRVKEVVSSCCACHSVAITADGKVLTWGRNDKGQLGLGDLLTRSTPTHVQSLDGLNVVSAACGKGHTLFLTDKGVVYSVGENKMGQLGHGNQVANVLIPQKVSSMIARFTSDVTHFPPPFQDLVHRETDRPNRSWRGVQSHRRLIRRTLYVRFAGIWTTW